MPDETHLGQTASNLVLLELTYIEWDSPEVHSFLRCLPDFGRTPSGYPGYSPPEGQVLIVTDVDWSYSGVIKPQFKVTIEIFLESLLGQTPGRWRPRERTTVFMSSLTMPENALVAESVAMTTGFVVPSGVRIKAEAFPGDLGGRLQTVRLRGYLAPDK
jgi:hypothetical protein